MYFIALATDYAEDGVVAEATLEALRELKRSEDTGHRKFAP